jgi:molecular chaperone GrpE (heat shock protein)
MVTKTSENKILLWLVQSLFFIALTVTSYTIKQNIDAIKENKEKIQQLELWRAETSANKFTTSDALAVWKEIASIKQQIAEIPNNYPIVMQRIDNIDKRLDENNKKLDQLIMKQFSTTK